MTTLDLPALAAWNAANTRAREAYHAEHGPVRAAPTKAERDATIVALYAEGHTQERVAELAGVSMPTVQRLLSTKGLSRPRGRRPEVPR